MEPEFPKEYIKYRDAVYKIAQSMESNARYDKEDLVSVGLQAIVKSISDYDPEKTTIPLENWVYNRIYNDMARVWVDNANVLSGVNQYAIKQNPELKDEMKAINRKTLSISGWRTPNSEDSLCPEEVFKVYAPTESYDPEQQTDKVLTSECLHQVMDALSVEEKDIVERKFFKEESIVNIAKEKDVPWHKVAQQLRVALEKMKTELSRRGIDSPHMT